MIFRTLAVATFGAALSLASSAFGADLNISAMTATAATPVPFAFQAGTTYTIQFIGTAQGGVYDAYNLSCPGGVCPNSGWSNSFLVQSPDDINLELIGIFNNSALVTYNSAAASLQAYQSSTLVDVSLPPPFNGVGASTELISQPWMVTAEQSGTVNFFIGDQGTRADNVGGVSLRITPQGVPEPSSWALMISGFAGVGAMIRRNRRRHPMVMA